MLLQVIQWQLWFLINYIMQSHFFSLINGLQYLTNPAHSHSLLARLLKLFCVSCFCFPAIWTWSVPVLEFVLTKTFERRKETNLLLSVVCVLKDIIWTAPIGLCVFICNTWIVFWLLWLSFCHHLGFSEPWHPWKAITHSLSVSQQHWSSRPNHWYWMQMTDGSLRPNTCNSSKSRQR